MTDIDTSLEWITGPDPGDDLPRKPGSVVCGGCKAVMTIELIGHDSVRYTHEAPVCDLWIGKTYRVSL